MIEDAPAVKELERLLAAVDILQPLSPEELERLALLSSSMRLEAGEAIALDGDRETLLLLASGSVRVHEPSSAGGLDLTFSMIEEGTVVAQTGFAVRLSRGLRVEALQPSRVLVLRWEDFEEVVLGNPRVAIKTIRLLSERLAVCEGRLSDLVRKEVPARLARLILSLSEHHGDVPGGSGMIPTRYTHQQLASMVGSNREAITRALGSLRKAGAVEIRDRRIYVTDADELERFAETGR